jgi:hypothetical protein
MCRIRLAIFAILLGFCTAADIANADEAWTALHAGRHVALMRHTELKSGLLYGVIIMAGERGILVFKRDTRTFLFLRADEVLNIEYMMPRDWPN